MSSIIGIGEFRAMLAEAAARVREGSDYLSQLDAAGGDGDHGTTMRRAMGEIDQIRVKYRPNGFICSVPGMSELLSLFDRCTPVRTKSPFV